MDIAKGDKVFILEYKNRESELFDSLVEIEVEIVEDNKINKIASGRTVINNTFINNNLGVYDKTSGIVIYKREGFLLVKNNKKFYIGCEFTGKKYHKKAKEYNGQDLFEIYIVSRLDDHVLVKFPLEDILFESINDVQEYVARLSIKHTQLYDDKITFLLNNNKVVVTNYEVYVNGKLITENYKERLFRYACKNKSSLNGEVYDFNKVFSLKIVNYEVSIKI